MQYIPQVKDICDFHAVQLLNLDSSNMEPEHWKMMVHTIRENYEKYWDDISPFIKFGCLKDTKFCDKMNDYILFKDINDKYQTLPELLVPVEDEKKDDEKTTEDAKTEESKSDDAKEEEKEPERSTIY